MSTISAANWNGIIFQSPLFWFDAAHGATALTRENRRFASGTCLKRKNFLIHFSLQSISQKKVKIAVRLHAEDKEEKGKY